MRQAVGLFSVLLGMAAFTPADAHHSFAMFDASQTTTVVGTVKAFEMVNPHGWLRVMVSDPEGRVSEWSMEMGGPGQLERQGWSKDTVRPGDKVTVRMHPLRDGSYGGQLLSVTLANGQVIGQNRF